VVQGDPPTEQAPNPGAPTEPNALRRAALVAGHSGDEALARRALDSGDERAAAAGLGALVRMGAISVDDLIGALHGPPLVARRACELSIDRFVGAAELDALLCGALRATDPLVVDAACVALGERRPGMAAERARDAVDALGTLSSIHRDAHVRESAIAALGTMGDAAGLPWVLAALGDRPSVRRRAAVALAAFSGDEAEGGLRRCLTDRDWQVRTVAETLLELPPSG
jgi:HEAT repeat protein